MWERFRVCLRISCKFSWRDLVDFSEALGWDFDSRSDGETRFLLRVGSLRNSLKRHPFWSAWEKKVVGSALEIVKDATSAFWPDIFYDICHSTQSLSWTHTKWVLPGVHLWTSGIWICPASIFRTQEGFWMLLDVGWGYTGPRKRTVCSCFRLGFATPCIWHRDRGVFFIAQWCQVGQYV